MKHLLIDTCVLICALVLGAQCLTLEHLPIGRSDDGRIVCRNEFNGEELDWFTLYKLPKSNNPSSLYRNLSEGTAYTLMTNKNQQWSFSSLSINDTFSAPGLTLSPLYATANKDNLGYILYNDQADKVTVIRGHTKGVILFDGTTAVWIVHSVPHYPPKRDDAAYKINPSQCVFGQSMLCMSFRFEELEKIGLQLLYNYPQVYDYNIPAKLLDSKGTVLNNLVKVINGDRIKSEPWSSKSTLTTLGGEQMMSFAKTTEFQDDLYSGLVAPNLMSNLLTETWSNGAGTLKSNCSAQVPYHVNNIEEVKIDTVLAGYKFSVHHDHSKWTVTRPADGVSDEHDESAHQSGAGTSSARVACIGDINRQEDQFKRAGGTVCFMRNENVWRAYSGIVNDVQECGQVQKLRWKKIKYTITGEALIWV